MSGLSVTTIVGPGDLPDGWDVASRRWAAALEVGLEIHDTDDAPGLVARLQSAAPHADGVLLSAGACADDGEVAAAVRDVREQQHTPVVHVDARPAPHPRGPVRQACSRAVHGRGRRSFQWALRHLVARHRRPTEEVAYGRHPAQVGDLRLPDGGGRHPVAVLVHGGFWLDPWERDLMDGLAVDLADRGWATWNVEYRRHGPTGGGYPASFEDVADATAHLDVLARDHPIDPARTALVGHSAGATMAVWATARRRDDGGPVPERLVLLAGVLDLAAAARDDLGRGAVRTLLADAEAHPLASPVERVPTGVPTLLVHGTDDQHVPPGQSHRYAARARSAGDDVVHVEVDGADHFGMLDPTSPVWAAVVDRLDPS